jgi:hypothetical protein
MCTLPNSRHERFSHLVASGVPPREAYISTGYSFKGARQAADRLLKRSDIRSRIAEFQHHIGVNVLAPPRASREWVLDQLMDNVSRIKAAANRGERFDSAGSNRALELLGRELGLFRDATDPMANFDGDLSRLDDRQLVGLIRWLEDAALGADDEARARFRAEEPALVINTTTNARVLPAATQSSKEEGTTPSIRTRS